MAARSTYAYRSRDAAGTIQSGTMVASSPEEVSSRLRADGNFVLRVEEHALRAEAERDRATARRNEVAKRVGRDEVIVLCQQLSVMLETGVPLSEALESFCAQSPSVAMRGILERVREDVFSGDPLSTALGRWPRVFPPLMLSLVRASEASGSMSSMMGRIGEYLAKERRTVRQIRGALSYPIFMMVMGVIMTMFLLAFVLPRFATIYEQRDAALPLPTQWLLAMSEVCTTQYMYYGPALVVLVTTGFLVRRRHTTRRVLDWARLHLPVLRTLYRKVYLTRLSRTMSTLLDAGINLLDIVSICRDITNNTEYDRFWDRLAEDLRNGRPVSEAFFASPLIPPSLASMIAAGERSGRLGEVMGRVATFTDEELDVAVRQVTAVIEPLMISIMGVVIGGVAMALLLPIFSMGRIVAG